MSGLPAEDSVAALAAIGLLAAIAALGLLWWRARRAPRTSAAIELLAVRGLGGRRMVALLGVGEQRFLVGLADSSISLISRIDPEENADATGGAAVDTESAARRTAAGGGV